MSPITREVGSIKNSLLSRVTRTCWGVHSRYSRMDGLLRRQGSRQQTHAGQLMGGVTTLKPFPFRISAAAACWKAGARISGARINKETKERRECSELQETLYLMTCRSSHSVLGQNIIRGHFLDIRSVGRLHCL